MIEGLKFDISADEMKDHFEERMGYHVARKDWYLGQVSNLEKGLAEPQQYTQGDPVKNLKDSAEGHLKKAAFFQFLFEHIIEDETYRLEQDELVKLEFIPGRVY